jgi:hypothetical protein
MFAGLSATHFMVGPAHRRRVNPYLEVVCMKILIRNALAIIVGFAAGACINMILVSVGARLVPPPPGVDSSSAESLNASVHFLEPRHYLFPFLAHALGTFAGAVVAYSMAGSRKALFAMIVGLFFLAGGIAAARMISAPGWFIAADLVLAYLPMAWLGVMVARQRAMAK